MTKEQKEQIRKLRNSGNGYTAALDGVSTEHFFSEEQFQQDVDYYRAQRIAKDMLEAGLISLSQFDKLSEINRKTFSPFLADIFPNTVDIPAEQR